MRWLLALALLATAGSARAAGDEAAPLKLWHAYRGGEEMALVQATELFTAKTGVKVDLLALPYDVYASKLTNAIPHGAGPDVFIFNHERLRNFHAQHLLAPTTGSLVRGDYFANAVEALELDGQVYGYPMSLKSLALYVNRKLVAKPPTTTAELLAMLPGLSDADAGRFGLAYESGDFYFHAAFLFGFGGELFDTSGRASFDTPGMARSLAFIKQLQDARYMPTEVSGALVKSLFNDGRAAMIISGPWFAGEIAPSVDYQVVGLPVVSETGIPMRPFLGVEAAFVSARANRAEQAQALARFLSQGEASRVRTTVGRQIPADVAAYEIQAVKDDTLISSFQAAAKHATPMPNTLEMARVWEPMKLTLRAVLQGGTEPQDAGALADRRYRALHRP
ncbi:extracellular solute-binding protein, partial [Pyxidicoccus sp. 3LG]